MWSLKTSVHQQVLARKDSHTKVNGRGIANSSDDWMHYLYSATVWKALALESLLPDKESFPEWNWELQNPSVSLNKVHLMSGIEIAVLRNFTMSKMYGSIPYRSLFSVYIYIAPQLHHLLSYSLPPFRAPVLLFSHWETDHNGCMTYKVPTQLERS